MRNKITVITVVLTIIIIIPVLFFSVYEIARLNDSEKELENTYNRQLDAILFSINLYSEDIISSWASKISENQPDKENDICENYKPFFNEVQQIRSVIFCDCNAQKIIASCFSDTSEDADRTLQQIKNISSDSIKKIKRLYRYYQAGYRKIESFGYNADYPSLFIIFIVNNSFYKDSLQACIIEVDGEKFIEQLLWKKIQSVSEERFDIGIIERKSGNLIDPSGNTNQAAQNFQVKKPFWLFPQYYMGIKLKGKTVGTLTKERNKLTMSLILFADALFILGAIFIFRNIKKEIKLTLIKSEFISNVSHEIRTPLALINMYIETLEMDRVKSEEKKKEYYRVIYNETQRLSGLVNKILNFSKIESGKRKFTFTKGNLNDVVEDVLRSYKFHLQSKGFELNLELSDQLEEITLDREAISDCIVNLIDNAIKYSKENKSVSIKTGKEAGFVYVSVTDKGIGISKDEHNLIFEKFYRVAKGDNVHDVKGTGLGLTIVKGIVEAHKGKVEVMSKPGVGSTFIIKLPENHTKS